MGKTMIRVSFVMAASLLALGGQAITARVQAQSVSANALINARTNCLTAVANTVGRPRESLTVIKQSKDSSGISIDVKVPNATAAWGCLTNREGKVEDVHFKGSEGAL